MDGEVLGLEPTGCVTYRAKKKKKNLSCSYACSMDYCFRHQLNRKKSKVDDQHPIRKPNAYPTQRLAEFLSDISTNEDSKDDADARSLSKSLVGGSMNICKIRIIKILEPGLLYYWLQVI